MITRTVPADPIRKKLKYNLVYCSFYTIFALETNKQRKIMDTKKNYKHRTREEIVAWFNAARERKEKWEQKMQDQWAEEERLRKEAAEKHYYDLEWV